MLPKLFALYEKLQARHEKRATAKQLKSDIEVICEAFDEGDADKLNAVFK